MANRREKVENSDRSYFLGYGSHLPASSWGEDFSQLSCPGPAFICITAVHQGRPQRKKQSLMTGAPWNPVSLPPAQGQVQCRCACLVTQSCPTLWDPMDCSPPGSSVRFFRQEDWSVLPFPSPGVLPDLGIKTASIVFPALQVDSLPSRCKRLVTNPSTL